MKKGHVWAAPVAVKKPSEIEEAGEEEDLDFTMMAAMSNKDAQNSDIDQEIREL